VAELLSAFVSTDPMVPAAFVTPRSSGRARQASRMLASPLPGREPSRKGSTFEDEAQ